MADIIIVGLGPGEVAHVTLGAWQALTEADVVWLRTVRHPVVAALPEHLILHSFDALYETAETFDEVYETIAARIIDRARQDSDAPVLYAVPGHPLMGESTVTRILARAHAADVSVRVVDGLSFVEPTLTALEIDALEGLQVLDALDVVTCYHPQINPDMPALIAQVYSRDVASELKLVLMHQYDDEHPVALVDAAGTAAQSVRWLPLYEIDRYEMTPLTSLYLSPLPPVSSFEGFQNTVAHLRAPDGCPWDREQTSASLQAGLLEETYEVLAAIDAEDSVALQEELGDLLLHIVLQAQIAVEMDDFRMSDVITGIDAKLKRRHPHVWGDVAAEDADAVLKNWESLKRQEREHQGQAEASLLAGVPLAMPALSQACEYSRRAARVGLTGEVLAEAGDFQQKPPSLDAEMLGELLLAYARWATERDLDPEGALRAANQRFAARVQAVEAAAHRRGETLEALSAQTLARLWSSARA